MPKTCRVCHIELNKKNCTPSFLKRKIKICRTCNGKQYKNRYSKYRIDILSKLGNKCQCCGSDRIQFLSIDHISGGGNQEKKIARGKKFIKKLYYMPINELKNKFQCLCFNCNYTKGFWGKCPHNFSNENINLNSLPISNRGINQIHLEQSSYQKRYLQLRQINRLKIKLEMIMAYGNECVQCHEIHPLFLTIDHINNNGALEKLRGNNFYQYLKKLGYPGKNTQLQLLCHNCNATKEYQNNRSLGLEIIKKISEIYINQPYYISEETEKQLWHKAKCIFYQLNY